MITFEHVLTIVTDLEDRELDRWIENRWIRPKVENGTYRFHEADVARARLVRDIRRDFGMDDDATAIVLSLIDHVYDLRRQMRQISAAIEEQPAEIRAAIAARIRRGPGGRES